MYLCILKNYNFKYKNMIYFIKAGDYVKIGYSVLVEKRFIALKCDCPIDMEMINVVEGNRATERDFQHYYRDLHHRGEWFRYDDSMHVIKEVPATESTVNKIRTQLRNEEVQTLIEECKKKKVFIHRDMFTKVGWSTVDKNDIKKYNKELTGCATYSRYKTFCEIYDILVVGGRNEKLSRETNIEVPTLINFKRIIKKRLPFWINMKEG